MRYEYQVFRGAPDDAQDWLVARGAEGWRCHSFEPAPSTSEVLVLMERIVQERSDGLMDCAAGIEMRS